MTAILSDRAAVFLRRAGLLAGLLAIIAGILGMHVLTGSHSVHLAGSSAAAQPQHAAQIDKSAHTHHLAQNHQTPAEQSGHGSHAHDSQDDAPTVTAGIITPDDDVPGPGACSCMGGDPCAGMSAMGGSCIPSGSTGTLAAPPPSTVSFAAETQAPGVAASSYAYLPESPSPADLCISRT